MVQYFYRVTDHQSVGTLEAGTREVPFDLRDPEKARRIVEEHADWANRKLTPLISMTDSVDKAEVYANQRKGFNRREITIWIINGEKLEWAGAKVYKMDDLVRSTGAKRKFAAKSSNEWVCVHLIPKSAVLGSLEITDSGPENYLFRQPSEVSGGTMDQLYDLNINFGNLTIRRISDTDDEGDDEEDEDEDGDDEEDEDGDDDEDEDEDGDEEGGDEEDEDEDEDDEDDEDEDEDEEDEDEEDVDEEYEDDGYE